MKHDSQSFLRDFSTMGSDKCDIFAGEFCMRAVFSKKPVATTFYHHIVNIVSACSKKQMLRVYAISTITMMAHHQVCRDSAVMQQVRNSMRAKCFPSPGNPTISRTGFVAEPTPTLCGITRNNPSPKSFVQRSGAWRFHSLASFTLSTPSMWGVFCKLGKGLFDVTARAAFHRAILRQMETTPGSEQWQPSRKLGFQAVALATKQGV
jgi:hypothetical protein